MFKPIRILLALLFSSFVFASLAPSAQAESITKIFSVTSASSTQVVNHADWGLILKRYVAVEPAGINRFDYAAVTAEDRARLKTYIAALEQIDPDLLNANEQHAYWINLYNALTVQVVLDHYPVASIRAIKSGLFTPGPWDLPLARVNGHALTLNNIEHDILRGNWGEPRIHYAVNCASLGCPNLAATPYTGKLLDSELDDAARSFVNHPRGVFVKDGQVTLSKIYNWYGADFGDGSPSAILAHIFPFAAPGLQAQLAGVQDVRGYQYDWNLNAPGAKFSLDD